MTWYDARKLCRNLNGELATVNSIDAVNAVSEVIESGGQYWIGLHRISWTTEKNKGTLIKK